MTSPKTAIVHDWITVPGGAELVLEEIYRLFPGVVIGAQFRPEKFPWLKDAEVRTSTINRLPFAQTRHYVYAPILADIYARMDLSEFDLILSDSHTFAHGVRKRPGALHICYYHTPARSLWAPEIDNRAGSGLIRNMIVRRLKRLDLIASKNPDVVLANSETTAERIRRVYKREVEEVIYPPVRTKAWLDVERKSDSEGYLMWGRVIPYKRIDLAIEAVRGTHTKLNVVGSGPLLERMKELATGLPNVVFHGRLPDEELKKLMANCRGVLFPGYEDFGIVPVEAMAAGLPVVAFGKGGASETVIETCGVQFGEQTPDALRAAMRQLEGRSFDPQVLRTQAAEFDEEVFRDKYKAAVERHVQEIRTS